MERVLDGDSLRVRCASGAAEVRLHCIDAPERDQVPWAKQSRRHLRGLASTEVRLVELDGTGVPDLRVRFAAGRWFEAVGAAERFEVVVSNPPYVAESEWDSLPEDVRLHEPRGAPLAGPDGLDDLRAIVDGAPRHLVAGGLLALELAETRAGEVAGWFTGSPAWESVEVLPDLAGRPRCLLARAPARA